MNWYHRGDARYVEYGTSFRASQSFGLKQSLTDTIYNMNLEHLSKDVLTVFERLDDADVRTAGTTYLMYRGRHRHEVSGDTALTRIASTVFRHAVYGPKELFYADIFASRKTPCRSQLGLPGVRDQHSGCVGEYMVEHDLFDFMLFSLPDNDTHSHKYGPFSQVDSLASADRQLERMMEPAGGPEAFLEDHAVIVCSDHSQSRVEQEIDLFNAFDGFDVLPAGRARAADAEVAVCPNSRAAQVYVLDRDRARRARAADRAHAARARGRRRRDADDRPPRRRGRHPRRARRDDQGAAVLARAATSSTRAGGAGAWRATSTCSRSRCATGRIGSAVYPDALGRTWSALRTRTAGEVLASARTGYEFLDWGGAHHVGGGSHGSLHANDSLGSLAVVRHRPGVGGRARAVVAARRGPDGVRALRGLTAIAVALAVPGAVPAAAGAQACWRLTAAEAIGIAAGTPQMRAERAAHPRSYRARVPRAAVALAGVAVRVAGGRGAGAGARRRPQRPGAGGVDRGPGAVADGARLPGLLRPGGEHVVDLDRAVRAVRAAVPARTAADAASRPRRAAGLRALLRGVQRRPSSALSVPTVYPLLAYLLARMLWVAWHPPAGPPALRVTANFLTVALMFLIGARIALNLTGERDRRRLRERRRRRPAGGRRAAVRRASRTRSRTATRTGRWRTRPTCRSSRRFPWGGGWDGLPAAHAAAIAFDLGCIALLWRLGGVLAAYLWAAYPFTLLVTASARTTRSCRCSSSPRCWPRRGRWRAARWPPLAGLTKLAPLALAPLLIGRRRGGGRRLRGHRRARARAVRPRHAVDRTVAFQADRESPFSIWGGAGGLQLAVQLAAAALAVAVAFVPRRRDGATVAALAAAVLIAAQLGADHWFYLYLVWFAPLVWLALLRAPAAAPTRSSPPAPGCELRMSTAFSHGSSSAAS